jgi:NhaA family Na+:H+ antiporter
VIERIEGEGGEPGGLLFRALYPFQRFFEIESAGGILLLVTAAFALIWANVWPAAYADVWAIDVTVGAPRFQLTLTLRDWINDGLMAVFFFLVGLEIKREILVGELASVRRATLPILAAVGGMAAPAAIYTIFAAGTPAGHGWGIPMATDIAFALGVLALLGRRIPPGLRVFLAALAIADDLGAVIVIAIFYTAHISWLAFGIGLGIFALLLLLNRLDVHDTVVYGVIGVVLWVAVLLSGVHATISGVLLALSVPARTRIDAASFIDRASALLDAFATSGVVGRGILSNEVQQEALRRLEKAAEHVQAPLMRFEERLTDWVSFGIIPLFALANAGVLLQGGLGAPYTYRVFFGVFFGLVAGKPIGIMLASWLAIRSGLASLPAGVRWRHLFGASLLGGIGFTMAIFIASLAFRIPAFLPAAKIAILLSSPIAGLAGLLVLGTMRPGDAQALALPPEVAPGGRAG